MRRLGVLIGLLLAGALHAETVTSNGTGGGRWSQAGTWAAGILPQSGDSVLIAATDTVVFDADLTEWPTGVAGVTIEGTLQASTDAGHYYLKTSGDLVLGAAGRLKVGAADSAYPSRCSFTIDFENKAGSIEGGNGGSASFYCARPAASVVSLSEAAEAGQMELKIDTSIAGDWLPADVIRIDDVDGALESDEHTIAPGVPAGNTIRLTQGLANAKRAGARVVLLSRNVRIVGSTDAAVRMMTGGVLDCEIRDCSVGVFAVTGVTVSGVVSNCISAVNASSSCLVSGTISGCSYGVVNSAACAVTAHISGCTHGIAYGAGNTISGTIAGCSYGVIHSFDDTVLGTIEGCLNGFYAGTGTLTSATFRDNRYDLRRVVSLFAGNTTFSGTTDNFEFNTSATPARSYVASYDHDGVAGAFKAWTRGGVIVSDVNMVPDGYDRSYRHICANAAKPSFRQEEFTVGPRQTLWVEGQIRIADNHSAWAPRLEIIDATADPLADGRNAPLASNTIPLPDGSLTDWQEVIVSYTNTDPLAKRVLVRCSAQRNRGDIYEVWTTFLE